MEIAVISAAMNEKESKNAAAFARTCGGSRVSRRAALAAYLSRKWVRGPRFTARDGSDYFDPWCEHLIVRDRASGDVVGTYRVLTAENARRLGAFCAERNSA
jgi:hypothetical protein